MVQQLRMACLGGLLAALVSSAGTAAAASKAVGVDGPGEGELVPVQPKGTGQELESSFEIGPASSEEATDAVGFSGCVAPFKTVSHRVSLPAGGSFLHRVVPDRRGFNVVMSIAYPGLSRTVNRFGPGRAEAFTVRTPSGRVSGRVRISGVSGSFGCYTLRVTP
jgi:hypothetical protein